MGYRDMDLDDQVRSALRKEKEVPTRDIQITVRNGIVYLNGSVTAYVHEHIVELVRRVESVAAVVDQMQVTTAEI